MNLKNNRDSNTWGIGIISICLLILTALVLPAEAANASIRSSNSLSLVSRSISHATTECGNGWYQGNFTNSWTARLRHGGAGGWRAVIGQDYIVGKKLWSGGTVPWRNGTPMELELRYSAVSNNATLLVNGALPSYNPVALSETVTSDFNAILITLKTSSESAGQVAALNLNVNGQPASPCNANTAQGSDGARDIKYILIENISGDFTLTCTAIFSWGTSPSDEGPALQIDVGTVPNPCPDWDMNCDGRCDVLDFSYFSSNWNGSGAPGWICADWNKDGRIDVLDFSGIFPNHWNETW